MAALIRTYSELTTLPTFEERFDYLNLREKSEQKHLGLTEFLIRSFIVRRNG